MDGLDCMDSRLRGNDDKEERRMTEAAHFLTYLAGTWHVDRQINVKGRADGKFQGLAHIRPTDMRGTFSYHEEGRFVDEDVKIEGTRDYLFKVKGDTLAIFFADTHRMGEHYVTLDFSDGVTAQDTYLCDDDIYGHIFEIISGEHFVTETTVSGPDKDYRLITHYRRI